MRLEPADIEAIAQRVVELLPARAKVANVRYVDAAELARVLSVERDWVYAHARELGAVRLGGPRGRLRFDLRQIQRTLAERRQPSTDGPQRAPRRRAPRPSDGLELLPYES
jgi:hypothetical protein